MIGLFLFLLGSALLAQEAVGEDFTELSLEELMELDVLFVNVLGTHTHLAGEWMIGSRSMFMHMRGNLDGTDSVSLDQVLEAFPVAPTQMDMSMHMLEIMQASADRLTWMVMVPYLDLSMDHVTRTGKTFTTRTQGVGDASVSVLYTALGDARAGENRLLVRAGLGLPTGSINERGATPAGSDQKLPYPMQLGSGTFDLLPGVSYLGHGEQWAWMWEAEGTVRLGTNSNGYRLGNRLSLVAWTARKLSEKASVSAQVEAHGWGDIIGADPELNPRVVPTADPTLRGGRYIDLSLALNFYAPAGRFEGNRIAVGGGLPLYQSLDGPQLELDWKLDLVWNWTF